VGTVFQFTGFGRYLGASIVVGILVTIGMLIGLVPFFIIWNATNSVIWLAVGLIVGVAIAIVLNLGFSFYSYLIIDRNAPGLSSLGESWRMVMPHFWPLFGLQILLALIVIGLFFAAIILGILLIIIGLLVTMPIWAVISFGMPTIAVANAYKAIAGEPIAN
jgi:uncharacterized membrane protein